MTYAPLINATAARYDLPPSVIAGIGSVETGWGLSSLMLPKGPAGTGDRTARSSRPPLRAQSLPPDGLGFGRGLMQIDWDSHQFARTGNWRDPEANISYACSVLAQNRNQCAAQAGQLGLSANDVLPVAIAAYNAGFGGVSQTIRQAGRADAVLGPRSYAAKVLARASWYRDNGFP
jgi:soluble lytic murein transglycosylase-like protein